MSLHTHTGIHTHTHTHTHTHAQYRHAGVVIIHTPLHTHTLTQYLDTHMHTHTQLFLLVHVSTLMLTQHQLLRLDHPVLIFRLSL